MTLPRRKSLYSSEIYDVVITARLTQCGPACLGRLSGYWHKSKKPQNKSSELQQIPPLLLGICEFYQSACRSQLRRHRGTIDGLLSSISPGLVTAATTATAITILFIAQQDSSRRLQQIPILSLALNQQQINDSITEKLLPTTLQDHLLDAKGRPTFTAA